MSSKRSSSSSSRPQRAKRTRTSEVGRYVATRSQKCDAEVDLPRELWVKITSMILDSSHGGTGLKNPKSLLTLRLCSRTLREVVNFVLLRHYNTTQELLIIHPVQAPMAVDSGLFFASLPVRLSCDYLAIASADDEENTNGEKDHSTSRDRNSSSSSRNPNKDLTWLWLLQCARPLELSLHLQYTAPETLRLNVVPLVTTMSTTLRRLAFCHVSLDMAWFDPAVASMQSPLETLELAEASVHWTQPSWDLPVRSLRLHRCLISVEPFVLTLLTVEEVIVSQSALVRVGRSTARREIELHLPRARSFSWCGHTRLDSVNRHGQRWFSNVILNLPVVEKLKLSLLDHVHLHFTCKPFPLLNLRLLSVGSSNGVKFPWTQTLNSGTRDMVAVMEDSVVPAHEQAWSGKASKSSTLPTIERLFIMSRFREVPWTKLLKGQLSKLRVLHMQGFDPAVVPTNANLPCLETVWIHCFQENFVLPQHMNTFIHMVQGITQLASHPSVYVILIEGLEWAAPPQLEGLLRVVQWADRRAFPDSDFIESFDYATDLQADIVDTLRLLDTDSDDDLLGHVIAAAAQTMIDNDSAL